MPRASNAQENNPNWQGGKTKHPLNHKYRSMKQRCYNARSADYEWYGGIGISVCNRWLDDFWNFVEDIEALGQCPQGWSLDRIDVNGNYEPSNVRWAPQSTQRLNQRRVRMIPAFGREMATVEWSEDPICVVPLKLLDNRLSRGWDPEQALTTPKRR